MPAPSDIRRIACLMLGEIGDLVVCLPALEALKDHYPDARITFVIRRPLVDLVALNPAVSAVLAYDNRNLAGKFVFVGRLLAGRWDLWVDLHTPTHNTWCTNEQVFRRNAFLMRLAGCTYRSGIAVAELAAGLTHPHPVPDEGALQSENIVRTTLRSVGYAGGPVPRKHLVLPDSAMHWAAGALRQAGMASLPRIALFFGAKQPADVWPIEHVREFIRRFARRWPGHALLLIGGPHELAASRALRDAIKTPGLRCADFIGHASLLQSCALISGADAMVSTDSGPMHLADALGVPLVTLFGAKAYLPVWLPLQPRLKVLNHRPSCSPCFSAVCPNDNLCMRSITPLSVEQALEDLLRGRA
jgi:ADP-heptose:LPS heptosyltransferase